MPQEILGATIITFFNLMTIVYKIRYTEEDEAAGTVDDEVTSETVDSLEQS